MEIKKLMIDFFNQKLLFENETIEIIFKGEYWLFKINDCIHFYKYEQLVPLNLFNKEIYKEMCVHVYSQYVRTKLNDLCGEIKH